MKKLYPIEMVDDHMAYIDPDSVVAIAPAHQQSQIGPGMSRQVGAMLILSGGTAMPVKGTQEEVVAKIAAMVEN